MDVTLALLADAANVSQDGKLNILGIFNGLGAAAFPATHPSMHLVLRFEASRAIPPQWRLPPWTEMSFPTSAWC